VIDLSRGRQILRCQSCGEVIKDPVLSDELCLKCSAYRENHAAVRRFLRDVPPPKRDLKDRVNRLEATVAALIESAPE
jgi:hypothetical protein